MRRYLLDALRDLKPPGDAVLPNEAALFGGAAGPGKPGVMRRMLEQAAVVASQGKHALVLTPRRGMLSCYWATRIALREPGERIRTHGTATRKR